MKHFKRFCDFIKEEAPVASKLSKEEDKCHRCDKLITDCICIEDDYFDAKIPTYAPKGKIKKGPHKSQK